jgi:hypothetical protein
MTALRRISSHGGISRRAHFARVIALPVVLTACAAPATRVQADDTTLLAGRSVDEWCTLMEPAPTSRAWQDIPWQVSFHDGLAAAADAQRPLLLWLMNGHPLGCT